MPEKEEGEESKWWHTLVEFILLLLGQKPKPVEQDPSKRAYDEESL